MSDEAIKLQGTCSLTTCERLYHQHLASQDEQQMEAMKLNLVAMANELGHSMQDALVDTGQFQGFGVDHHGAPHAVQQGHGFDAGLAHGDFFVLGAGQFHQGSLQAHQAFVELEQGRLDVGDVVFALRRIWMCGHVLLLAPVHGCAPQQTGSWGWITRPTPSI